MPLYRKLQLPRKQRIHSFFGPGKHEISIFAAVINPPPITKCAVNVSLG